MHHGTPAGAMAFNLDGTPVIRKSTLENYMQSKVGGCWLADEFSKRLGSQNILSVVGDIGISYSFEILTRVRV